MTRLAAAAVLLALLGLFWPMTPVSGDLLDSLLPPLSQGFPLGTDSQGRDLLAGTAFGLRVSVKVALGALGIALGLGVAAGLVAAACGGVVDAAVMRLADVQSAFPALLLALLLDGVARLDGASAQVLPDAVLVALAIGLARWPPLARVTRAAAISVRHREFVVAARLAAAAAGRPAWRAVLAHTVPNILAPVAVLASLDIGLAVTDEATLSFLGVGLPPSHPSLGTLIRLGQADLLSGAGWPVVVPGAALVGIVLAAMAGGERIRARYVAA